MLNTVHRSLALMILLFISLHLINHIIAVFGIEAHIQFMEFTRKFYRHPIIEPVLLIALFAQVFIGLYFVYRSWGKRQGFFQRAQAISGCYLALFIFLHVAATLNARWSLDLDTNFYFATAGIHLVDLRYYFIPYYFLAVVAIFTHIASALHWVISKKGDTSTAKKISVGVIVLGITIASFIIAILTGVFYDVSIPVEYEAVFG